MRVPVLTALACAAALGACAGRDDPASRVRVTAQASAQPARIAAAPAPDAAGFAGVAQLFRVAAPAPDGARAVPFARPDLSGDADERARAQLVRFALLRNDMATAQQVANTRALRELVGQNEMEFARYVKEDRDATLADLERPGHVEH